MANVPTTGIVPRAWAALVRKLRAFFAKTPRSGDATEAASAAAGHVEDSFAGVGSAGRQNPPNVVVITDCHLTETKRGWREYGMAYLAALADTAVYFVVLILFSISIIYIQSRNDTVDLGLEFNVQVLGLLAAAVIWLIIGLVRTPFSFPERARLRSYAAFKGRFQALEHNRSVLKEQLKRTPSGGAAQALVELDAYREAIAGQFAKMDLRWVRAEGYLFLREYLSRAEESLFIEEFKDAAVNEGLHLERQLLNSKVPDSAGLLRSVRHAVKALKPAVAHHLSEQPPEDDSADKAEVEAALFGLREASRVVSEFRAERWAAIIRARNSLLDIAVLVGLGVTALLGITVMNNVDQKHIIAGMIFYIVGAMAGWFHWWWVEANAQKLVDDFGLRAARLVGAIVLSGTAALAGVVFVQLWPEVSALDLVLPDTPTPSVTLTATTTSTPTPTQTPTASATETPPIPGIGAGAALQQQAQATPTRKATASPTASGATPTSTVTATATIEATPTRGPGDGYERLGRTFDLDENIIGLFVAAVFGFTPQLVVLFLQRPTEKYKDELRSTDPDSE